MAIVKMVFSTKSGLAVKTICRSEEEGVTVRAAGIRINFMLITTKWLLMDMGGLLWRGVGRCHLIRWRWGGHVGFAFIAVKLRRCSMLLLSREIISYS